MFSELLEQCKQVFKSADATIKQNKKALQQSRMIFPIQEPNKLDPTKTFGNAASFTKAQRFKQKQKQELNLTDVSFCQSEMSQQASDKKKCFTFTKGQRFMDDKLRQKNIANSTSVLYPNYEAVKKSNRQAPIMKLPVGKDLSKSNISQATAATLNEVGPGKYFVQKIDIEAKRSAAFSKQKRFQKQKLHYEDNPLFINETHTKKRPATSVMKKKIIKNAKLISKQQQQEMRERFKMIYWQSIPLQLDRLFKSKAGPVLKENYFNIKNMTGRQKRCAMLMMLDRLNYLRGGFENDIRQKIEDKPCAAVYRKSTPKPFKFSQMEPGPDFYYPQDDLTRPGLVGYSFGKDGAGPQKVLYDDRDYEINQETFKKGGNIIINPIHKEHVLTIEQVHALNRGPGYYDCLFGQVQKRNDVGVMKFVDITETNARQNNCVDIKKDVNDALYFPSYDAIDPNVPGPLYKQNANVKPMHLPDKVLFPEHWLFYDGDLNKVRAEIAKNVILAKNMDFQTYKRYTKRFEAFKQYLKMREPIPDVGEYDVKFDQIDGHVQGFEMSKKPEKTLIDPIVKVQGDVEGDNLLLNPAQLKQHLPNMDFKKMVGRPQFEENNSVDDEPREGDRLLLEPKQLQKKLPEIKFQKMKGRQNALDDIDPDQPVEGNVLILNPKPIEKHLPNIDFSKQPYRVEPEILQLAEEKQFIVIGSDNTNDNEKQPDNPVQKKIKGFVDMKRMSTIRLVPVLRQKSKNKNTKKQGSLSKRNKRNQTIQSQNYEQPSNQNN